MSRDRRLFLAFKANPLPSHQEPTMARAIPMHPELPHLTHLSYFVIGGGQPKGRTEVVRRSRTMENAAQVIQAVLQAHQVKAAGATA